VTTESTNQTFEGQPDLERHSEHCCWSVRPRPAAHPRADRGGLAQQPIRWSNATAREAAPPPAVVEPNSLRDHRDNQRLCGGPRVHRRVRVATD